MFKRPIFCFFFALLATRVPVLATEYPPLTKLGIAQGLANNSVRCIFQDHDGYMWFGPYDGLSFALVANGDKSISVNIAPGFANTSAGEMPQSISTPALT